MDLILQKIKSSEKKEDDMLWLTEKFEPLIKKYTYKLNYEYAQSDLIIFLIELINYLRTLNFKNDAQVVSYIAYAMKNQYIKLSKSKQKIEQNEICVDFNTEIYLFPPKIQNFNENRILIEDSLLQLTPLQREVIVDIFLKDLSAVAIAKKHHCSKQAITNIKRRALTRMKQFIENHNDS